MIGNDDRLFDIYSRVFERNGQVDSEIIFALIEFFSSSGNDIVESIRKAGKALSGSIAAAMVHRKSPHILWLFRRNNPCSVILYRDIGLLFWASSEEFIQRAQAGRNFGRPTEIKLPEHSGIGINLETNQMNRFQFPTYAATTSTS
jgi:hypothetical protein